MSAPDLSGLLPATEVARLFGRTLRTLSNWEQAGVLVPVRVRRQRYYRVAELQALLTGEATVLHDEGLLQQRYKQVT